MIFQSECIPPFHWLDRVSVCFPEYSFCAHAGKSFWINCARSTPLQRIRLIVETGRPFLSKSSGSCTNASKPHNVHLCDVTAGFLFHCVDCRRVDEGKNPDVFVHEQLLKVSRENDEARSRLFAATVRLHLFPVRVVSSILSFAVVFDSVQILKESIGAHLTGIAPESKSAPSS